MGYTHYFYLHRDAPAQAFGRTALDAKRLFAVAAEQGYDLAGPMGDGEPQLDEGAIAFNGRGDESYETFRLPADPSEGTMETDPGWYFSCCKIGFMDPASFRAYGDVVEALLIRAKVHYGEHLRVASDGAWESDRGGWGDWSKGCTLYEAAFGGPAVCPFEEFDA